MKSSLLVSGISFILSLLLGVLSGNLLVTLLVRSIVTSLVVTGGYLAITQVLKKFVPELFDLIDSNSSSQDGVSDGNETIDRLGKRVNLVVDDEDSLDALSENHSSNRNNLFDTESGLDEVVEEVQETGVSNIDSKVEFNQTSDDQFLEDDQEISDNELPDISGLQSTFVSNESSEEQENSSQSDDDYPEETQYSSSGRSSKSGDGQLVADPKILAKAISTALKKGQ
jgi:hypothetical protein